MQKVLKLSDKNLSPTSLFNLILSGIQSKESRIVHYRINLNRIFHSLATAYLIHSIAPKALTEYDLV